MASWVDGDRLAQKLQTDGSWFGLFYGAVHLKLCGSEHDSEARGLVSPRLSACF